MIKGKSLVESYQKIWNEFKEKINQGTPSHTDKLLDRGFVFQFDEEITDVDVLFMGINPSYNDKAKEAVAAKKEEKHFYTKEQALNHSYFKPFERIDDELKQRYNRNITWTHVDLLVFRETQQSYIKDTLCKDSYGLEFLWKQLMVAKKIVEHINPKILVVSNTQARVFLGADKSMNKKGEAQGVWMGYDFKFDEELGTYRIINNKDFKPYVFFSSMLSGQRALDNGSKERLIWHINEALKK